MHTNTDEDTFSAAHCGMQRAQYDEMDMADQPQQKLNNNVRRPFPISQSLSLFSYMTPSPPSPAPPPPTPPLSSILLPPLFISALRSYSGALHLSYSSPLSPRFSSRSLHALPSGFPDFKTHPQTDSGTE